MEDNDLKYNPASNLAIYKKGEEILNVVQQICDLFPEEYKKLQFLKTDLIADATTLVV